MIVAIPFCHPEVWEIANIDLIQRELIGQCNRINPHYLPRLFPVSFADRSILVVWAPGGDNRPYERAEDGNVR